MIAAPRMYCTPTEWWVQPTEYTQAVVFSRPLFADDRFADLDEVCRRDAADVLHHLRRVAGVVPLEHLEHGQSILQRLVPPDPAVRNVRAVATHLMAGSTLGLGLLVVRRLVGSGVLDVLFLTGSRRRRRNPLVLPGSRVVGARLRVVAGEHAVQIVDVDEVLPQDRGGVGVSDDVVVEVGVVGQDVVDDAAQEGDVATGAQRYVLVGDRRRAGEPGVDVDDRGALGLGLHHPLEPDRMTLGHVRALDDDAIRVRQVLLKTGGAAAAEGSSQTGNGGAVSNTGLVLDLDGAHCGEDLLDQVVLFIVQGGPAQRRRCPACGERGCPCSSWSCQVRSRVSATRSATIVMAVSRSSGLPLGAVRTSVEHLSAAGRGN